MLHENAENLPWVVIVFALETVFTGFFAVDVIYQMDA